MNERLPETREFEIAESFERGERQGSSDPENRILQAYLRNQEGLRQVALPKFDANQLARRMAAEMKRGHRRESVANFWRRRFFKLATPGAVFAVVLVLLYFVPMWGNPIDSVQFRNDSQPVTWWWKHNLQSGRVVTIPQNAGAVIQLSDRSVIDCAPGTRFAVRYGNVRHLRLDTGRIHVKAAKNSNCPMIVETPFGKAKVVGTVFTIEVIQ